MRYWFIFFTSVFFIQSLIGQDSLCANIDTNLCYINAPFPISNQIGLDKKWESNTGINSSQTPLLADINGDCIAEIFAVGPGMKNIFIFDSANDTLVHEIETYNIAKGPASFVIGDVNLDGEVEIIVAISDIDINPINVRRKLVCYNLQGLILWISDQNYKYRGCPALADFNQDGIPEVYIENIIYNAQTGKMLAKGVNGYNYDPVVSVAAQLDNSTSNLELAINHFVYNVDIVNINGELGNSLTPKSISVGNTERLGSTTVGDINNDGQLDVIVSSQGNSSVNTILYAYTYSNDTLKLLASVPFGFIRYIGAPTIGIIDPSGETTILITYDNTIFAYTYNGTETLQEKWSYPIDESFARIGMTLYDLNNDLINEIIIRDHSKLRIIDASVIHPIEIASLQCISGTLNENPVVGNLLNNRNGNICVTCINENIFESNLCVLGSPDTLLPWPPARSIWNQFNYHVLNVNDDLTIPQEMKNNATFKNGKYNNFFVQESLLDENGMQKHKAANLTGQINCINYDTTSKNYVVEFELYNLSDASLDAPDSLFVSFYDGDPEVDGNLIGTYYTKDTIGSGEDLLNLNFSFTASNLVQLYLVINSDKNTNSPFDNEDYNLLECDYSDNILQYLNFPSISMIEEHICNGDSYDFYSNTLYTEGSYYHIEPNNQGCDSLILMLELNVSDTIQISMSYSDCDAYTWNDSTYTSSGIYSYHDISANGCDSIVSLALTINNSSNSMMNHIACDSFIWNNTVYKESGLFQYSSTNIQGCDSIANLDLIINFSSNTQLTHAACDSFTWNGQTYTESGTYMYNGTSSKACDSIVTLDLVISDKIERQDTFMICQGDSIEVFGQWYDEEAELSESYEIQSGCDSFQLVKIIVSPLLTGNISRSICKGDSVIIYGQWFDTAGEFELNKPNIGSCDSLFMINIIERNLAFSYDTLQFCEGDTSNVLGFDVFDEQTVMQTYPSSNTCDSVASIFVTFLEKTSSEEDILLCPGDSTWLEDSWVTEPGVYTDHFNAMNGCDSAVNTTVTLLNIPNEPIYDIDCEALEINTSIDIQDQGWQITWSNGAMVEETSYTEGGHIQVILFYEPDCHETYELILPELPVLSEIPTFSNFIVGVDSSINLSLGLDSEWQVNWSTIDIIDCHDCMDVVIAPTENVEVMITLTHSSGCEFMKTFKIIIEEEEKAFDVPNIFDENLETWSITLPKHIDIIQEAAIYDRWGNQLKKWKNTKEIHWDGTFSGQDLQPGVFVYYLKYLVIGDNTAVIKRGEVTLVR